MPEEKRPGGGAETKDRGHRNLWIYLPVLLVFVSITSFIAGTRIGRNTDRRLGKMLDTIILSPEGETVDETHIDFSGQIWNADGTPCADRLLELHSNPMRTVTDSDGFFHFKGVEIGEHHLLMLDEDERETGDIAIKIDRDSQVSYGRAEGMSGSVRLAVSEQAIELHIQIQMDGQNGMSVKPEIYVREPGDVFRDTSGAESDSAVYRNREEPPIPESGEGQVDRGNEIEEGQPERPLTDEEKQASGQNAGRTEAEVAALNGEPGSSQAGSMEPESIQPESPQQETQQQETPAETPSESPEKESTAAGTGGHSGDSSPVRPTKPTDPTEEPTKPTEPTEPTKPTEPTEEPTKPTEPTKPADPLDVGVQEKGGPVWTQNTAISLFADRTGTGEDRKLLPGSKGTYEFSVSNRNNYGVLYRMNINAPQGQLLLPLRYRLKSDGEYLCGDDGTWLTSDQLFAETVTLEPESQKEYLLEWKWLYDGGDDAYDTRIGTAENLEYHVIVNIIIEQIVS